MKIYTLANWEYWYDRSMQTWYATERDLYGNQISGVLCANTKPEIIADVKEQISSAMEDYFPGQSKRTNVVAKHKCGHVVMYNRTTEGVRGTITNARWKAFYEKWDCDDCRLRRKIERGVA